MSLEIDAITFDDFNTLRYGISEEEDIVYPIFRELKRSQLDIRQKEFLKEYFKMDELCRKRLCETLRESLLDDVIASALATFGYGSKSINETIGKAVNEVLATRKANWYPEAIETLLALRKRGYKLGLISNTHWRLLEDVRNEFKRYFHVITLSYEHGYAKPHPSIFLVTLKKLGVRASRCLHVGDDPIADVQGARHVGIKTAFVKRGDQKAEADIQIEKLSALLNFL